MAGTASGKSGTEMSSAHDCHPGEAMAEWRSSQLVENGTPSTSLSYWDTDEEDGGPKPSQLYGKHTWKIEKFTQINKRELRSNPFEIGGYKWYILIYPQGCDVCNHLSLFLCVANHEKLLPGWSYFAQFTIAVVNMDPKKSKYSDTLHRFWKKEHDWGWKKFMELSKVKDGFIVAGSLTINAQVQVIRERANRPFRCLDCHYRGELVRVYLTNVEQICRRFVEERRANLVRLIEDEPRWLSFRTFWSAMDQNTQRRMAKEKTDAILKVAVKHFFIEKEVTSTLVMDSLYSGLKALEGQSDSKKGRAKRHDVEDSPAPIVRVEKDMFLLADDVLLLLERAALEPLPPKDDKVPQNRTKDINSGEDSNKDSIEPFERRLTELGRRTVEIFVLTHIFSNKIEVAYQEAVALQRQEELIREEEAAWLVESGQKAKRGTLEKDKKSKKKQSKQKRNNRKGKDRGRECIVTQENLLDEESIEKNDSIVEDELPAVENCVSDVSDSVEGGIELLPLDSGERDTSPVNWDTDTSEFHHSSEARSNGLNELSSVANSTDKRSLSVMDDSSSTCSTDSVPSVAMTGPYKGNSFSNYQTKKSPSRGKNRHVREICDTVGWANEVDNQVLHSVDHPDSTRTNKASESESETAQSMSGSTNWVEPNTVKKEVVQPHKKLGSKDDREISKKEKPAASLPLPNSMPKNLPSSFPSKSSPDIQLKSSPDFQLKSERRITAETADPPPPVEKVKSIGSQQNGKKASLATFSETSSSKASHEPSEKPVPSMSRPSSAPLTPIPRPTTTPVISMVQTSPLLARSVSAVGRLGPESSPATHSYGPQSYRNAITGNPLSSASPSFNHPSVLSTAAVNSSAAYSQGPPVFLPQSYRQSDSNSIQSGFSYGLVPDITRNGSQWLESSQRDPNSYLHYDPSLHLLPGIQNLDFNTDVAACTTGRQTRGVLTDEFPHIDIINDLLEEEHEIWTDTANNLRSQFPFGRLSDCVYAFPCEPSAPVEYLARSSSTLGYMNGRIEGLVPNQWQMTSSEVSSIMGLRNQDAVGYPYHSRDYSTLEAGASANGFTVFRPSNGH